MINRGLRMLSGMRHKKNALYKKIIRSRTPSAEDKYKLYKNKFKSVLRFAEKSYYSSLLVANKEDAKGTWTVLNTVINKKSVQMIYQSNLNVMVKIYRIN